MAWAGCRDATDQGGGLAELAWRYPSESSCELVSPAGDGARVYAGFSDGYVRALSLASGALQWQTAVGGGALFDDVKVVGGRVIAQTGAEVLAIDATSGAIQWVSSDSADYPRGVLSFDSSSSVVIAGSQVHSLWAMDVASGITAWRIGVDARIRSTSVDGGTVFAAGIDDSGGAADAVGRVYAVDLGSRAVRWEFVAPRLQASAGFVAPLAVYDGVVLANAASGRAYGIAVANGTEMWHLDAATFLGGSVSDGVRAYVPSSNGTLYAVDLHTGALAWSANLGPLSLYTRPVLLGDRLLLTKAGSTLYAIDRASGQTAWTYRTSLANICSAPLVLGDTVVFAAEDGIYALRLRK